MRRQGIRSSREGIEGKLTPADVKEAVEYHADEHMVKPKLVYISNSTEVGSIYSKAELAALSNVCREHNLLLFMDGARLGSALTSDKNDLTLEEIANLVDAFYIGGTKNGALIGEALVIITESLKEDFRYHIKQKGALLARGAYWEFSSGSSSVTICSSSWQNMPTEWRENPGRPD